MFLGTSSEGYRESTTSDIRMLDGAPKERKNSSKCCLLCLSKKFETYSMNFLYFIG